MRFAQAGVEIVPIEVCPRSSKRSCGRAGGSIWRIACCGATSRCSKPGSCSAPGYDAPPEADALASCASPEILQLLLQLERASEWPTARGLALQIDRESRDELPVIPLWQVDDHYAWRDRLKGPAESRVTSIKGSKLGRSRPGSPGIRGKRRETANRLCAHVIGLCAVFHVVGSPRAYAQRPKPTPPSATGAEATALERRPYRISLHLGFDPSARIDEAKGPRLIREWQVLVRRFVGPPWVVTIADRSSPLANVELDALEPEAFAGFASFDKVWVMRVARPTDRARGSCSRAGVRHGLTAARAPPGSARARVIGCAAGAAPVHSRPVQSDRRDHRGRRGPGSLESSGGHDRAGEPVRRGRREGNGLHAAAVGLAARRQGADLQIPHTYLQVESVEGPVARCAIISACVIRSRSGWRVRTAWPRWG